MDGLGLHPAPPSRSPLSARAFGSEVLLGELIGRGGMSRVYRGWLRGTGIEVAVKVLRDDLAGRPEAVQRFVRERDLLAAVASPHVVRVHELVVDGDELGIVMDLVPGGHLRRAVGFPCPPESAAQLTAQIADGLAAVHATGVIHRDLKPENVLVDRDDDGDVLLRLTDFGISRLVDAAQLTQTSVTGTPGYLAPEVAAGARVTAAADVYALGVVLYELCTGRGPFLADNPLVLVLAHTRQDPPRPGGMPDPLWGLLAAMLAKDPGARPSAAQVADGLRALLPALIGVPTCTPPEPRADDPSPPSAGTSTPDAASAPDTAPPTRPSPAAPAAFPDPSPFPDPAVPPPPSRRALLRQPEPPADPAGRRLPQVLRRPPVLAAAAVSAALVVLLTAFGLRAVLGSEDTVTPVPSPLPVAQPTGPTASAPAVAPPTSPVAPRTIVAQLPSRSPSPSGATKGSTTASPSPTPSPDVPTLALTDTSNTDRHSSDRQARLTVGGIKVNAGTLASITVRYDDGDGVADGSVTVPLEPAGAASYPVTVEGLTNGRQYTFVAVVCSSTTLCSAPSAPFAFTPYGVPQIRRPTLTVSGQTVTVLWSSVDRNSHPGQTRCQIVVSGTPEDAQAPRFQVDPEQAGSRSFTGRPSTTYVATQSCRTDEVPDGAESSNTVTTDAPPPSPSPTVPTTPTTPAAPAGAA